MQDVGPALDWPLLKDIVAGVEKLPRPVD